MLLAYSAAMSLAKNFTLLIADDSDNERLLMRAYLNYGLLSDENILEARNGEEIRQHLKESSIDCMILDYLMEGENGIEIIESLRSEYSLPPIIFATGYADPELYQTAKALGVVDFIDKNKLTADYLQKIVTELMNKIAV
jgi:CheY-like chemotaxis protein